MPRLSTARSPLDSLLTQVRSCRLCASQLPCKPHPVLRAASSARLLIIGQAPGSKVHETGIPWNDASGIRLRGWLGLSREQFYSTEDVAIVPMGFCYPGKGKAGDLPPRPECAPTWHASIRALLPNIELTLLIGHYAQLGYLGERRQRTLTDTVQHYADFLPHYFPLPHPSPRNQLWLASNPWFDAEVVPALRQRVRGLLD